MFPQSVHDSTAGDRESTHLKKGQETEQHKFVTPPKLPYLKKGNNLGNKRNTTEGK